MTTKHIAVPALVFNGVEIHDRNEMLCLTDMWKAQGSDPARQPSNWLGSADAKRFIETLDVLEPGNSGVQTKRGGRGVGGVTWAHWQIGLAYAKYLSPEFHMWCNTVVRERMEGKPASGISPDVLEMIERTNGICRKLIHKVTLLENGAHFQTILPAMVESALLEAGHVVSTDYKPALQVLIDKKVPVKRRRAFSQKCSARLRRFALTTGKPPRLSRETSRYLFHVDTIRDWLDHEGNALISGHISALAGQGVLPFRKK